MIQFDNFESRFDYIKSILESNNRIPDSVINKEDYQAVYYFFKHYAQNEEVIKLKYIYADVDCFPLDGKKARRIKPSNFNLKNLFKVRQLKWSCDYVLYVYKKYGVVPAENSYPMQLIKRASLIEDKITDGYYANSIKSVIDEITNLGCNEPSILLLKNIIYFSDSK